MVTKDVPEGATVVGVPARQMNKGDARPSDEASFMPYAVHSGLDSDPRERTIRALVNEMQSQALCTQQPRKTAGQSCPSGSSEKTKTKIQTEIWQLVGGHGFDNQ